MAHAAAHEPAVAPVDNTGILDRFLSHVRSWFERDVKPDIDDLKSGMAKVKELLPGLQTIANLAVTLAKADPGISPGLVADAEEAAEIVARAVAELGAAGV